MEKEDLEIDDSMLPQPSVAITDQLVIQLAMSLANKLNTTEDVMNSLGLTPEQFRSTIQTEYFKRVFADAKAAWESSTNSTERIRAKGNMLIEDVMLDLYSRVKSPLTADADVVKLVDSIAKLSNMAPTMQQDMGNGAMFSVTINLQNAPPTELSGNIIDVPQQIEGTNG